MEQVEKAERSWTPSSLYLIFFSRGGMIKDLVRNEFNFNDGNMGKTQLPCFPPLKIARFQI